MTDPEIPDAKAVVAAALPALHRQWRERVLQAIELHGSVHWCRAEDTTEPLYDPKTKRWPCPTLSAALGEFGEGT